MEPAFSIWCLTSRPSSGLERLYAAKLRPGNVHSAEDWDELLLPEIGPAPVPTGRTAAPPASARTLF